MPPPSRELRDVAAIVGVGETDYGADYRAQREKPPGYEPPSVEGLATLAFDRALADAGLSRDEIDTLSVSFTYGGPDPQAMAAALGFAPRRAFANGNIMAGPLPVVCAEIAAGRAETVAMVFAVATRSIGRVFGGDTHMAGQVGAPPSYYYYHPWGWSSQAAHWALIQRHYQAVFGVTEADVGAIAVQLRRNAALTDNAVMRAPMTIEDYLASRYVVRPLHLFDMCLVNDGAVCLIVRRADLARRGAKPPAMVSGWGADFVRADKMHAMVRERLRPQMQRAGQQALDMAGARLAEIGHFECYDPAAIHIVDQMEGYGFFDVGCGVAAFGSGEAGPGGRLPVNTSGGMLSGAYMQGWSHVVECVRQLRGEAGARQVPGVRRSMSSLAQTSAAHPIVFTRGD